MYDVAVIGGGAAGLSAALSAALRNKRTLLVNGAGIESSALFKAERVDNYPGMPGVSGRELLEAFYSHASAAGVEVMPGRALQLMRMEGYFAVQVERSAIEAAAAVVAVGVTRKGRIKGEAELVGKGVSYCATCDGMLYRGRRVVVVGESGHAEEEVGFLSEICGEVLYFTKNEIKSVYNPNVTVLGDEIKEIAGDGEVSGIVTSGGEFECDGVFIIRDAMPVESLIYGLDTVNGVISADPQTRTNIGGLFACGDCTGAPYQAAKAAGQGLVAGLMAAGYVDSIKRGSV